MFNEWLFQTASLEGLELGMRLHRAGHAVLLSKDVSVPHLRHHDVLGVFGSVWRHSSVLLRSLGYFHSRGLARSHLVHALNSPMGFVAIAAAIGAVFAIWSAGLPWWLGAIAAFAAVVVTNSTVHRFFARKRGILFSIVVAPLHLVTQMVGNIALASGLILRHVIGDPAPDPTTQAFAEVGVEMWPPVPRKQESLKQESQR
jgi:hypothetical protein